MNIYEKNNNIFLKDPVPPTGFLHQWIPRERLLPKKNIKIIKLLSQKCCAKLINRFCQFVVIFLATLLELGADASED